MHYDERLWGALSSWLTVIVYIVNAFLLYRALRSQVAVQKNAQKQTDLQRYLIREQIKPRFTIELITCRTLTGQSIEITGQALFKSGSRDAHNVTVPHDVRFAGINVTASSMPSVSFAHLPRNSEVPYNFKLAGDLIPAQFHGGNIGMSFHIVSCDDFQNEYQQEFALSFSVASENHAADAALTSEPVLTQLRGIIFNT